MPQARHAMPTLRPGLRRRITAALAALVTGVLTVTGIVALTAPAAAVSGLTGPLGGNVWVPVGDGDLVLAGEDDVMVTAWLLDATGPTPVASVEATATTDAEGEFAFDPLPAGSYAFEYGYRGGAPNIVGGFRMGGVTIEEKLAGYDVQFIAIAEDESPDLSWTLWEGAIIRGQVVGQDSAPLAGQPVEVWRATFDVGGQYWHEHTSATTDPAGEFVVDSLPQGTYNIRVGGAAGYIAEFWEDAFVSQPDHGTTFSLAPGDVWENTIALEKGAKISGTVKDTAGKALQYVTATAYLADQDGFYQPFASATTGSKGTYTIDGLPEGDYKVGFRSSDAAPVKHVDRYWSAAATLDEAGSLWLAAGATRPGVNVTMTKGATISGVITLAGGGHPAAEDIEIRVCQEWDPCRYWWSEYYGTATYDAGTGKYAVGALPGGRFSLRVEYVGTENYRSETYDDVHGTDAATPIVLKTGGTATGVNVQLDAGTTITGTVTVGGIPHAGVPVAVYPASRTGGWDPVRTAITDENGQYTVTGIDDGHYQVHAEPEHTFAQRWNGGAYDLKTAPALTATPGATLAGVDFELEEGVTITGTVTFAGTADPLPFPTVQVFRFTSPGSDVSTQVHTPFWNAGDDGSYSFAVLPPGQYVVRVDRSPDHNTLLRYHGDSGDEAGATRLTLLNPGESAVADIEVDVAGAYTGRIVDETGQPVQDAWVGTEEDWRYCYDRDDDCRTDANGEFLIGLFEPGAHTLTVDAPSDDYVLRMEIQAPAVTTNSAPVDLGDIVLERGSTVSGVVIGVDGKALREVGVAAYVRTADEDLEQVGTMITDSAGRFDITGLPSEPVFLSFYPFGDTRGQYYGEQFLGGNFDWTLSESVPLPAPGTHAYREVRLLSGSTISGVVKNLATGAVIPDADVRAVLISTKHAENYGNSRRTNSKGAYSLPGMEPGSYEVWFEVEAWDDGVAGDRFETLQKKVFVPERAKVKVDAAMAGNVKLIGVLRDSSGRAIPSGEVNAYPVGATPGEPISVRTDEKGSYTFYLRPGTWILQGYDYLRSGAGVYSGGVFDPADATPITLTRAAVVHNLTLPAASGAIHADSVSGTDDPNPVGVVELQRVIDGDPVSFEPWGRIAAGLGDQMLGGGFTLENVPEGDYNVSIYAQTLEEPNRLFPNLVIEDVHVGPGETVELGDLDLGTSILFEETDWVSRPVDGAGPSVELLSAELTVGGLLHAEPGDWTGWPTGFTYRWLRDGHPIPGATEQDYQLAPGDAGAEISVRVIPMLGDGPYNDLPTSPVAYPGTVAPADAPFPLDVPLVGGTPVVGKTLTVTPGMWNTPNLAFSYQWLRDGVAIASATKAGYKLTAADAGVPLSVRVTASRPGFETATYDVAVGPVQPAVAMKRTKAGTVTSTADGWTVTPGTWSPKSTASSPITFVYTWRVYDEDGTWTDIPGTSHLADAGIKAGDERVTVLISASKPGYTTTTVEVPVRTGPVPYFATPELAGLVTTAPGGTVPRVGYPITLEGIEDMGPRPATGTVNYQWQRADTELSQPKPITGATSATYIPVAADAGKYLRLTVTLRASGYAAPTAPQQWYSFAAPTLAGDAFLSEEPVITGDATIGSTLTADPGSWEPEPTKFAYQWLRNGKAITGATKQTYVLPASALGAKISVRVTASKAGIPTLSRTSQEVTVDAAVPFVTEAPTITGDPNVGRTLTATPGTWTPAPTKVTYQWYRDGKAIKGATKAKYTVVAADEDRTLTVRTTGSKAGLPTASSEASVEVGPPLPTVNLTAPSIGTTARVGAKLTVSTGTWLLKPTGFSYQWYLNGAAIQGATASSYTPIIADIGGDISVAVVAKKKGFPDSAPVWSQAVTVEPGAAITASKAPALSVQGKSAKTVKLGKTVSATAGTWPVAALSISYQWQVRRDDPDVGWVDLPGATAKTLYLDPDAESDFRAGYLYRVVVTAERVGYRTGPAAISAAITAVP